MRGPGGAVFIMLAISAALLLFLPASSASADRVEIFYQERPGIHVEFPDGNVTYNGKLTIIVSSSLYDMTEASVGLYKFGTDGEPDMTSQLDTHYSTSMSEGNKETYTFTNLTEDVTLYFSDLQPLERPTVEGTSKGTAGNNILAASVMGAASVLALIMLVLMADMIRKIDSFSKGSENRI
jgi:hypothetical protein